MSFAPKVKDDEQTIDELFIDDDNINHIWSNLNSIYLRYGKPKITRQTAKQLLIDYAKEHQFLDHSVGNNQRETLSYYNKHFTKYTVMPKIPYNVPDHNPMIEKINGKLFADFSPEDYGRLDVWQADPIYADKYNTRKHRGNKGMNNPHIIGAHKRHYANTDDGLRDHEKGPSRTHGYNMSSIYSQSQYIIDGEY